MGTYILLKSRCAGSTAAAGKILLEEALCDMVSLADHLEPRSFQSGVDARTEKSRWFQKAQNGRLLFC
jgi:hypothetical protein